MNSASALVLGDAAAQFPQAREQALAAIRAKHPLPPLDGTIDVYNWDQADVLAHGLDYSPRPIFQSYSAYTPGLIDRNAESLAGPKAPDFVLFALQAIDNRLPALEDGKSWPLLWSRYDAVSLVSTHALLQRRVRSDRPIVWGEESASTIGWEEPLALSTSGAGACVWAVVEIKANLAGRLLSTAFKAPGVEIDLKLADGGTVRRRFIPGMSRTGFLLSPYVEDLTDFLDVCDAGGRPASRKVDSLSFHATDRGRPFFDGQIRVKTRSLTIGGAREVPPDASFDQAQAWGSLGDALIQRGASECAHPLRWADGKILAHAPCTVSMGRPRTGTLEIGFGIFPGAWDPGQTDGVRFEVRGLTSDGWQTLAVRELRPRESEPDRAGGSVVLDIPEGTEELILLTDPLGNTNWDWSYWGVIR